MFMFLYLQSSPPQRRSCGDRDSLKRLIDAAHGMGISVLLDIVHSHGTLHYIILYSVLYYIILYYIVLYYIVL